MASLTKRRRQRPSPGRLAFTTSPTRSSPQSGPANAVRARSPGKRPDCTPARSTSEGANDDSPRSVRGNQDDSTEGHRRRSPSDDPRRALPRVAEPDNEPTQRGELGVRAPSSGTVCERSAPTTPAPSASTRRCSSETTRTGEGTSARSPSAGRTDGADVYSLAVEAALGHPGVG